MHSGNLCAASPENLKKVEIQDFRYGEETYSPKHFVDKFRRQLPVVVKVAEGFCSPDEGKFTFSVEDAYWISHIKTQKRIIGKSKVGLNFSIPYEHNIKFIVHEDGEEPWGPSTLDNIFLVEDYDGCKIMDLEPTKAEVVTVWHGADSMDTMTLSKLQLIDTYEETYLVGNPVIHKSLYDFRCPIPVFLPIKLSVATGIAGSKKQKAFEKEMKRLREATSCFPNESAIGNREIMIFTDDQVDAVGGAYEYIDPYGTVANVPFRGKDGYDLVVKGPILPHPDTPPPALSPRPSQRHPEGRPRAPEPGMKHQASPMSKKRPALPEIPRNIIAPPGRGEHHPALNRALEKTQLRIPEGNEYSDSPPLPPKPEPLDDAEPSFAGDSGISSDVTASKSGGVTTAESGDVTEPVGSDDDDYEHPELENVYEELGQVPHDIDFKNVTKREVGSFLRLLKLHKYISVFFDEDIDGALLLDLDKEILVKDFHFTKIEAMKLHKFVHDGWRPR